jgi:hypothetical protein
MMKRNNQLTLFCPNLIPSLQSQGLLQGMKGLYPLLQYAKPIEREPLECSMFQELSIAKAVAANQGALLEYHQYVIAEPVHIVLDQTRGYLRQLTQSVLTEAVMADLTQVMNEFAKEMRIDILYLPEVASWLWRIPDKADYPAISSPIFLQGQSILDAMPTPDKSPLLFEYFNALQIVLHDVPSLKSAGVNAIWFWGNGDRSLGFGGVMSEDWYLAQYADYQGIPYQKDYDVKLFQQAHDVILVNDIALRQPMTVECAKGLDEAVFLPLVEDFFARRIDRILLDLGLNTLFLLEKKRWPRWVYQLLSRNTRDL